MTKGVSQQVNSETLTVPEAAALLGIGRDLAYRAAATGELPTVRIGRRILVPRRQLALMLGGDIPMPTSSPEKEPSR